MFMLVHQHYTRLKDRLAVKSPPVDAPFPSVRGAKTVIVPVDDINRATVQTVDYARTLSTSITAVHVTDSEDAATSALVRRWEALYPTVPLVVIESPWRSFVTPMLTYLDTIEAKNGGSETLVVLPELITDHFWEGPLHNKSSALLKRALAKRQDTIIIEVPVRLDETKPRPANGA